MCMLWVACSPHISASYRSRTTLRRRCWRPSTHSATCVAARDYSAPIGAVSIRYASVRTLPPELLFAGARPSLPTSIERAPGRPSTRPASLPLYWSRAAEAAAQPLHDEIQEVADGRWGSVYWLSDGVDHYQPSRRSHYTVSCYNVVVIRRLCSSRVSNIILVRFVL